MLVWDGLIVPWLSEVNAAARESTLVSVSPLLPVIGNSFADFSAQFEPFLSNTDALSSDEAIRHHLSIAGKAMAYAALGRIDTEAFPRTPLIIGGFCAITMDNARMLGAKGASNRDQLIPGLSNVDIIATFQAYLGTHLLRRLIAVVERRFPSRRVNLAIGGGCALNVKLNP